ncbi:MAG: SOSS complex subunit B family protein [Candidatus Micrarchaeota archaeon]
MAENQAKEGETMGADADLGLYFENADQYKPEPIARTIQELEVGIKNQFVAVVERVGQVKTKNSKSGFLLQILEVELRDETGSIPLALFNRQIDMVNEGDLLLIRNAEVKEFNGEVQLTIGKYTHLENTGKKKKESQLRWRQEK